jgi:hypothetical protein
MRNPKDVFCFLPISLISLSYTPKGLNMESPIGGWATTCLDLVIRVIFDLYLLLISIICLKVECVKALLGFRTTTQKWVLMFEGVWGKEG